MLFDMLLDRLNQPAFAFIVLAVLSTLILLTVFVVSIAKFYRRCGADEALVRTGAGGNKVVIGGGVIVYPILHQLLRVSLRSIKLQVERSGRNALVTKDKIRANVTTELYIKVEPHRRRTFSLRRAPSASAISRARHRRADRGQAHRRVPLVAANQTFMDLHGQRKEFAEHIQSALVRGAQEERVDPRERVDHRARHGAGQGARRAATYSTPRAFAPSPSRCSRTPRRPTGSREKEIAIKTQNVRPGSARSILPRPRSGPRPSKPSASSPRSCAAYDRARGADRRPEGARGVRDRSPKDDRDGAPGGREGDHDRQDRQAEGYAGRRDRSRANPRGRDHREAEGHEAAEIVKQKAVETGSHLQADRDPQSEEHEARAAALKAQAEAERRRKLRPSSPSRRPRAPTARGRRRSSRPRSPRKERASPPSKTPSRSSSMRRQRRAR